MSVGISYPDFSGRYVRIKYLAVSSATLIGLAGAYGIDDILLFKAFDFKNEPAEIVLFSAIWLFSLFSIYGLLQRYRFEKVLISSGLMSLRATITSLRKRTLEVKNPYQELIKEVFEYKKFNTKRPLEKFDRVKSDIISSKLFGFLEEYYPTVMYANKKVEQLSNKITVSHFEEGESSFSHLRSSLELSLIHI